ncbi:MAG: hypothetical protein K9M03_03815 [Kiritimatiellales bacterium]|nr:hypothetical protein [Kiritimatiellales bacterium]
MKLPPLSFVVLDTETTGFIPRVNRIIEFAGVRVENGKIASEYEKLISIPTEIPETVQVLTRIKQDALEEQPTFDDVRDDIADFIGPDTLIIGQNVGFDIRMLRGEGIDLTNNPWIDTSMLASLVYPELASFSLGYVSTVLKLKHSPVHRAMGDVNATLELLSKCWNRFQELPDELIDISKIIMGKSSAGYQMLFETLVKANNKKQPKWMQITTPKVSAKVHVSPLAQSIFEKPSKGSVTLVEEPLAPTTLQQLLDAAANDDSTVHWVAVKNLEASLRRLTVPQGVRVLYPPNLLIDIEAATRFATQEVFTADEASLALKLAWFEPENLRSIRAHGEEYSVWNGKLACTNASDNYTKQFEDLPTVLLLDHNQLLNFVADPNHCAQSALDDRAHIIIDDASMLEDTATKAYGWYCSLDYIRAGAEGNESLMSFTDALQIWIEKARQDKDIYELHKEDLSKPEVTGINERLSEVLEGAGLPTPLLEQLLDIQKILDGNNCAGRIVWIEKRQDGAQYLHAVPENISEILADNLYNKFSTTLLIPHKSADTLTEILPSSQTTTVLKSSATELDHLPITFEDKSIESFLRKPVGDKTIILLPSRRLIEDNFIKYTEELEEKGTTIICQNLSGGLERMQAEFTAASTPCVWLLTPWTYEGVSLDPEMVDHLVLMSLPFDHPHNMTFAKRSEHYQSGFMEYGLPRLEHRLFRLLRAYCRHRTSGGGVTVLDKRLTEKKYGERVKNYLEQFMQTAKEMPAPKKRKIKPKKTTKIISDDQLALF